MRKIFRLRRRMPRTKTNPKTGKHTLRELAQSKCTWTCHQRHFVRKFSGKMPYAYPAASILRELAQSKCTWTCHKRHFVRKFTGKMPDASDATSIEHRALTLTVRTPQCGHTVWGKKTWTGLIIFCVSEYNFGMWSQCGSPWGHTNGFSFLIDPIWGVNTFDHTQMIQPHPCVRLEKLNSLYLGLQIPLVQ